MASVPLHSNSSETLHQRARDFIHDTMLTIHKVPQLLYNQTNYITAHELLHEYEQFFASVTPDKWPEEAVYHAAEIKHYLKSYRQQ